MKLWEIKAQSLRLMFADSDLQFSQAEFANAIVYNNANTKEKLIRMNDSIARAIDLYYQYNKEQTKIWDNVPLFFTIEEVDGETVYTFQNRLNASTKPSDFSHPTRVDLLEDKQYINPQNDIDFYFDESDESIHFISQDFANLYASDEAKLALRFRVFYKIDIKNIDTSLTVNEITLDVSVETNVPEDVQRMIPYFVKGELYEEDEADIARAAKQEYLAYVAQRPRKQFSKVQTKVSQKYRRTRGY
jgi:hypothetical protein